MNLIEVTKIIKEKEKNRNKQLGQKEMLMEGFKKLGFKNLGEAKKESHGLKNALVKMREHYQKGTNKFQEEFGHLLE